MSTRPTQYSLFGAEAAALSVDDLDGLMPAGAQWVRSGAGARLSVVVADRWRADAVAEAFVARGVAGTENVIDSATGFAVRTRFTPDLLGHAARWTRGASQGVPAAFALSAAGLRLWAIAAGRLDDVGYLLPTSESHDSMHRVAGAALSRLGVTAVSLTQRPGPGWRITSTRRLRRLVELLGPGPDGCGSDWPLAVTPSPLTKPLSNR